MKILFVHTRSLTDVSEVLKKVDIKGKMGLVSSIQFLDQLKKAQKLLKNSIIIGQILGCNVKNAEKYKNKIDSFLFIGSGRFHPLYLAIKTKKSVYIANPDTNEFSRSMCIGVVVSFILNQSLKKPMPTTGPLSK